MPPLTLLHLAVPLTTAKKDLGHPYPFLNVCSDVFRVVVEASVGEKAQSDIAIDDVSLTPGCRYVYSPQYSSHIFRPFHVIILNTSKVLQRAYLIFHEIGQS